MTFCCFDLYLDNETLYEFHRVEFFAPYDPRTNLTCITTLSNNADYFTILADSDKISDLIMCPP